MCDNVIGDTGAKLESNASFDCREKKSKPKKDKVRKLQLKLLSTFLFACAAVATIQTTIKLPIFSDIFSPQPSAAVEEQEPYVSSLDFQNFQDNYMGTNKYLKFRANFDAGFDNYTLIYYDVKNLTDDVEIEGPFIDTENYALFTFAKTDPVKDFEIRVWCVAKDASKLKYTETKSKSGYTLYLIYTANTSY